MRIATSHFPFARCCIHSILLSAGMLIQPAFPVLADDAPILVSSVDTINLSEKKRTSLGLYLTATEAAAVKSSHPDALFIDVRTRAEVNFIGIAAMADKNIPYMQVDDLWTFDAQKGTYKLVVNPDFPAAIAKLVSDRHLGKDALIVLMCRSGHRSAKAANYLAQTGYTRVYTVVDGFEGDKGPDGSRTVNGWKNSGLKWSYKLAPEVAYESPSF